MDSQAIVSELKDTIGGYLKDQGLELVDFIYRYQGRDLFLRVLVDAPQGGITLEECSRVNIRISRILDESNILQREYILEVSSPGLDRPLKTISDFSRCINRRARFFLSQPMGGKIELEGTINNVGDGSVCVDIGGDIVEVPLSKLNKAKQIIT